MDFSQLAGQVMMIGYMGSAPSAEVIEWIKERNIGGIKIFGWNTNDLSLLQKSIEEMQKAALKTELKIPLFIATDQEGGWVRHVKGSSSITPGNMALGASEIINDSYMTGFYIGKELKALGINMNFAPTVDILINHEAHVIGPRAFSDDPLRTAILATSYANGMKEAGIICTAKHFPGHGRTSDDSHGRLPIIETTLDELFSTDLLPYDFLIKENLPSIMSGHLAFPSVTGDKRPASLSPFFLKDVLREKMEFNGIIITDDMQMNGALYKNSLSESCLAALKAGNDIVMVSRDLSEYEKIRNLIISEMRNNPDFEKQIRKSVERIISVKHEYLDMETSQLKKAIQNIYPIPAEGAPLFFHQQAFRSVSLLQGDKLIKKPEENERILLAGPLRLFFEEGLKRFPNADSYFFPYNPFYKAQENDLKKMPDIASGYDTVIFCSANVAGIEILKTLKNSRCRVIVLSVLSPASLSSLRWLDGGVAVYGTGRESFTAGFAAIAGDFIPEGVLPLVTKDTQKSD
ncbi:MAG: beta-N-acetylhexosaminidase [Spirochaetaceae bacterium]|nr:beta-N-acetylhexosaminidase [Spirochaetaceae bacterium]